MFQGMRNLVALDVDGTLLPSWQPEGAGLDQVTAPYQSPGKLSRAVTERLLALDAELVWLTTWGHDANDGFSHILGRLPVLDSDSEDRWWKAQALHDYVTTHGPYDRIVWLDDEMGGYAQDVAWVADALAAVGTQLLVIGPELMRGLQREDLASARRFLGAGS